MNGALKLAASLSLSGTLLFLVLMALRPLLRGRVSRRWQYYIWLVVLARLLIPLAPEVNLVGTLFQWVEAPPVQMQSVSPPETSDAAAPVPAARPEPEESPLPSGPPAIQEAAEAIGRNLGLIWLGAALVLLVRKVTAYQSFTRYLRAGGRAVDDPAVLNALAALGEEAGVKRPVELIVCPLAPSPVLIGGLRPCIVLPTLELPVEEFRCTVLHELVHCRRWDRAYKWLAQWTLCLHWYNPFVHWMVREIGRDCELACDEAVLDLLPGSERRAYGDTLLHALGAGGRLPGGAASVTLCEDGKQLKERLDAIMNFKKQTKRTAVLSLALAGALLAGATAAGAYVGPAKKPAEKPAVMDRAKPAVYDSRADEAQTAYDLGNLPRFGRAFARLTEAEQKTWMEKLYSDGEIAFFSVGLNNRSSDAFLQDLAETVYRDGPVSFFSILTWEMGEEDLEDWLERAGKDGRTSYQMVLLDALDRDLEREELEKEFAKEQDAAYAAVGVTKEGKDRYYKGELVSIFLDQQGKGYYFLDMNPDGKVDIKIVREDEYGAITGVAYLTEAERERLFGAPFAGSAEEEEKTGSDWDDDWGDDDCNSGELIVAVEAERIKDGDYLWLGTYEMKDGDHVRYEVTAEDGDRLAVGFVKPGETGTTYNTISNRRRGDESLEVTGTFTWAADRVEPGTYRLFVCAEDGDLTDVEGVVTIRSAEE